MRVAPVSLVLLVLSCRTPNDYCYYADHYFYFHYCYDYYNYNYNYNYNNNNNYYYYYYCNLRSLLSALPLATLC